MDCNSSGSWKYSICYNSRKNQNKLGNIQIITKSGECNDDIREKLSNLKQHSSIAVIGKTRKNEKSPTGILIELK